MKGDGKGWKEGQMCRIRRKGRDKQTLEQADKKDFSDNFQHSLMMNDIRIEKLGS